MSQPKHSIADNTFSAYGHYYLIKHLTLITGLTDRTIRNYLTLGILQGEKINGLWHFTAEQVEEFLRHPAVRPSILAKQNSLIYDFLAASKKTANETCMILDLPGTDAEKLTEYFNHEFMSDTSANCAFTDNGIEITHKQAAQLDSYNFDVALYGPIERVVNTKNLIMQTPQKFPYVPVEKLHGINNTGWEYKTYFDLEHDPTFIAREIENNMFARTPKGSSWGTVIANCVDVLEFINQNYEGKNILLISQGSVLRAMQILLRARKHPWDDFTVSGMYHVGDDSKKKKDYGIIAKVF